MRIRVSLLFCLILVELNFDGYSIFTLCGEDLGAIATCRELDWVVGEVEELDSISI